MYKSLLKLCSFSLLFGGAIMANADDDYARYAPDAKYEVTVTNITKGQSFTPILAASHKRSISFFELGQPASSELGTLAESGNTGPLNDLLGTLPKLVKETAGTEGLLVPGQSVTFKISANRHFNRLSLAAMLIPTNDTFVALDTVPLPRRGLREYLVSAYDAGTEPNDELCANIPGPVCGGEGASPDEGGEGYVYISPGIHGEADLSRSGYDWRERVAKISVRRIY